MGEIRKVRYVVGDVTQWESPRKFALWHDPAVFHFLLDDGARAGYRRAVASALAPGSMAIIATFNLNGPDRCSGLPVCRYSGDTLASELEGILRLIEVRHEEHSTPTGAKQPFVYGLFERIGPHSATVRPPDDRDVGCDHQAGATA